MTQKRKRNHWVPRSYPRAFAADPAKTEIWRCIKVAGSPEVKPIDIKRMWLEQIGSATWLFLEFIFSSRDLIEVFAEIIASEDCGLATRPPSPP